MLVEKLPFPEKVISVLKESVNELNEPQAKAVKAGLLDDKNLVVASPTASGKTLIAELAILKKFLKNEKSVYLVPLKALASEKYSEFRDKYGKLGMKIALSIGDLDSSEEWLDSYDIIIISNEKMDSLMRHNAGWIKKISLVIADEIHMINDPGRGPTLEVVLTRLRRLNPQIIALSATIKNAEEIAEWLGATLVKSDYRPVKLCKGVFYPNILDINDKKMQLGGDGDLENIISKDTVKRNKQALVFLSSRRSAEATAEKISEEIKINNEALKKISREIETALPYPTKQCKRLARVVEKGCAFHHAGLVAKQRKLIEDAFRAGTIKIITATPTLSFGVNLPAWRVVIRDVKRYTNFGMQYLPVLEVHQMFGRAGRPKYDTEGEAIVMAKSEKEALDLKERYIDSESEPIYSKLSVEPVLRMHVLALIAGGIEKKSRLEEFFSETFFAHQYEDMEGVMDKVEKILKQLESYGFIVVLNETPFVSKDFVPAFALHSDAKLTATPIGMRVSELYLDPESANKIIQGLKKFSSDLGYLVLINSCIEMWPLLRVRQKDGDAVEEELIKSGVAAPDSWNIDYDDFMMSFKTALMFNDWADECSEDALLDKYDIAPGELYGKITNADWMLHASGELARLLDEKGAATSLNKLRIRIKHGIKEELLDLVRIKNIGRVRARLLWKNNLKTARDVRNASEEKLGKILGKAIARQLKQEAQESLDKKMRSIKFSGE